MPSLSLNAGSNLELLEKFGELVKTEHAKNSHSKELNSMQAYDYQTAMRRITREGESALVITDKKGKFLGYLMYYSSGHKIVTRRTYVLPEYRRKGIAKKLTFRLMAIARRKGFAGMKKLKQEGYMKNIAKKMIKKGRVSYSSNFPDKPENAHYDQFDNLKIKFNEHRKLKKSTKRPSKHKRRK